MKSINRTAILFQPKQPFIDWLNLQESSNYVYELKERRNDAGLFLIDDVKHIADIRNFINEKFQYFFEFELDRYPFDKKTWPNTNSFTTFNKWIDFTYHTIIKDMSEIPIERDSY